MHRYALNTAQKLCLDPLGVLRALPIPIAELRERKEGQGRVSEGREEKEREGREKDTIALLSDFLSTPTTHKVSERHIEVLTCKAVERRG